MVKNSDPGVSTAWFPLFAPPFLHWLNLHKLYTCSKPQVFTGERGIIRYTKGNDAFHARSTELGELHPLEMRALVKAVELWWETGCKVGCSTTGTCPHTEQCGRTAWVSGRAPLGQGALQGSWVPAGTLQKREEINRLRCKTQL